MFFKRLNGKFRGDGSNDSFQVNQVWKALGSFGKILP